MNSLLKASFVQNCNAEFCLLWFAAYYTSPCSYRSQITKEAASAAFDISVAVGFFTMLLYSFRMFQITEDATNELSQSSTDGIRSFASQQLTALNFIKSRVLAMIWFFIFASFVSATINILQTAWAVESITTSSQNNCTMSSYVQEIPEPSFVQDFIDGTCCCILLICSMLSLNWRHLVAKPAGKNNDSSHSLPRFHDDD